MSVLDILNVKSPDIFSHLDLHAENGSHKVDLVKKIVGCFLTLRLRYMCKNLNERLYDKNVRRVLTKTILFQNQ